MADYPIAFSAPMILALLAGRKTVTRRVLTPQPAPDFIEAAIGREELTFRPAFLFGGPTHQMLRRLPRPGSRLWVRESYFQYGHWEPIEGARTKGGRQKWGFIPDLPQILFDPPQAYRKGMHSADSATPAWHKRLGRFMPRNASRMTLIVTDVRVERLQDITHDDAMAEGILRHEVEGGATLRDLDTDEVQQLTVLKWSGAPGLPKRGMERRAFQDLWESINGAESWAENPFVAAYSFRMERRNIDEEAR